VFAFFQGALHGSLAQDRQRTGGRGNHDIHIGQVVGNLGQQNAFAVILLGQPLGPLQGAVGHHKILHASFREVPGHQFDGLPGAHQQCLVAGQVGKDVVRHVHRSVGHRNRVLANRGLGANALGHGESLLEQARQKFARGAVFPRRRVGILQLAENLGFAQHHGIQTGGHTHHVPNGIGIAMYINHAFKVGCIQVMEPCKPA